MKLKFKQSIDLATLLSIFPGYCPRDGSDNSWIPNKILYCVFSKTADAPFTPLVLKSKRTGGTSSSGNNNIQAFRTSWLSSLKRSDRVDCLDRVNKWYTATAVAEREGARLLIRFDGWSSKFDEWIETKTESHRISKYNTIATGGK
eukprot:178932_1